MKKDSMKNGSMKNGNQVVEDGMVVRMDYELALDDGELIDSSAETGPLEFVQGSGEIIEGLAEALYGMAAGEEKQVVVTPDLAYGDYDPEAYQVVPRDSFPPDVDLSEGDPLDLFDEETGEQIEAYIGGFEDDNVIIDFNHPLAGETLHFTVRIVDMRPATPEELDHGHVHNGAQH
jgi:FKBP-type peptidyl-prolyl cis-trans isomerase SlyD